MHAGGFTGVAALPSPQFTRKCCMAFMKCAVFMILELNRLQNQNIAALIDSAQLTEAAKAPNLPEKTCRANRWH